MTSSASRRSDLEIWHTTIAAEGRHPLLRTEDDLRRAVRALARVAGGFLVHFCVVDEHLHLVLVGSRERAGRLAGAVGLALRPLATSGMAPSHHRPVRDRRHLETLVDYVLGQPRRHGLPGHPALWTGSAFADLIGARHLPGLDLRLREILPRLSSSKVHAAVGITGDPIRPLPLPDVRRRGAFAVPVAAAAALAAPVSLLGNEPSAKAARVAVVHLARAVGMHPSEIAAALGVRPRSVRQLAQRRVAPDVLRAVRMRMALEERVRPR